MADGFTLSGSYSVQPLTSALSFAESVVAQISEAVQLSAKQVVDYDLTSDSPQTVAFGGVANANVVIMKALGDKVVAHITTADGTSQAVPFDTYWIWMCQGSPMTAITLTRAPGVETSVRVFLGQQA